MGRVSDAAARMLVTDVHGALGGLDAPSVRYEAAQLAADLLDARRDLAAMTERAESVEAERDRLRFVLRRIVSREDCYSHDSGAGVRAEILAASGTKPHVKESVRPCGWTLSGRMRCAEPASRLVLSPDGAVVTHPLCPVHAAVLQDRRCRAGQHVTVTAVSFGSGGPAPDPRPNAATPDSDTTRRSDERRFFCFHCASSSDTPQIPHFDDCPVAIARVALGVEVDLG